ncbi:hypothetical protein HDV63DRAFT_408875 [Trichoderma sp. SZMC 28014]
MSVSESAGSAGVYKRPEPAIEALCSSDNFPSATVATHLASTKVQLEEAKRQLRDLQDEWENNIRLEEGLCKKLASMEKAPGKSDAHHPNQSASRNKWSSLCWTTLKLSTK